MFKILNKLKKSIKKNDKTYFAYGCYIVLTGFAIFYAPYTRLLAGWVLWVDLSVEQIMGLILRGSALIVHLNCIIALVLTPILIVAIPAAIYRFVKHGMPPYLIQTIWVLWMIATVSRLLSQ